MAVALLAACGPDPQPTPIPGASVKPESDETGAAPTSLVGDAALHNGKPSLEALGEAVVAALATRDGRALTGLSVAQQEFEQRLFGAVVTEAKERRPGPAAVWKARSRENLTQMSAALGEHGGKGYTFVSLESTQQAARGGLVVHRNPRLTVKDGEGERELAILGEVLEHPASGTFVILSFTH